MRNIVQSEHAVELAADLRASDGGVLVDSEDVARLVRHHLSRRFDAEQDSVELLERGTVRGVQRDRLLDGLRKCAEENFGGADCEANEIDNNHSNGGRLETENAPNSAKCRFSTHNIKTFQRYKMVIFH